MHSLGATIVNTDTGDVFAYTDDEFTALLFEFKVQIAEYLATLTHTNMRTLADLIAFNLAHCPEELVYYGQWYHPLREAMQAFQQEASFPGRRAGIINQRVPPRWLRDP